MRSRERYSNQRNVQTNLSRRSRVRFQGIVSLEPEAIIGNISRRTSELKQEGQRRTARAATALVQAFINNHARLLIPEKTPYLLKAATWTADLSLLLWTTCHCWKAVEMSMQLVGVPSTKRVFVACVQTHPSMEEPLTRWKARLISMRIQPVMLEQFVGRESSYLLNRTQGEHKISSCEDPCFVVWHSGDV